MGREMSKEKKQGCLEIMVGDGEPWGFCGADRSQDRGLSEVGVLVSGQNCWQD